MSIGKDIHHLRREYTAEKLSEKAVDKNPIKQFETWFTEALSANVNEPNAMTLATATKEGIPSARIVLLKGFDKSGFAFYTNYLSRKGKELARNPHGCLVMFWPELHRQIRIEGKIRKTDKESSEAYFHSRPLESQISAISSPQSQVIPNREIIEIAVNQNAEKYKDKSVPKPSHWGGYVLDPVSIEFWQGQPSRLHDRIRYVLMEKGKWKIERLAP